MKMGNRVFTVTAAGLLGLFASSNLHAQSKLQGEPAPPESFLRYSAAASSCTGRTQGPGDLTTKHIYYSEPEIRVWSNLDDTEAARQRKWYGAVHDELKERMMVDLGGSMAKGSIIECGGTVNAGQVNSYATENEAKNAIIDIKSKLTSLYFETESNPNYPTKTRVVSAYIGGQHIISYAERDSLYQKYLEKFAPKKELEKDKPSGAELARQKLAQKMATGKSVVSSSNTNGAELARAKLEQAMAGAGPAQAASQLPVFDGNGLLNVMRPLDAGRPSTPFRRRVMGSYNQPKYLSATMYSPLDKGWDDPIVYPVFVGDYLLLLTYGNEAGSLKFYDDNGREELIQSYELLETVFKLDTIKFRPLPPHRGSVNEQKDIRFPKGKATGRFIYVKGKGIYDAKSKQPMQFPSFVPLEKFGEKNEEGYRVPNSEFFFPKDGKFLKKLNSDGTVGNEFGLILNEIYKNIVAFSEDGKYIAMFVSPSIGWDKLYVFPIRE